MISCFSVQDPEGPDADHSDDRVDPGAVAPVSVAQADDEVASTQARADEARERLARLRKTAESVDTGSPNSEEPSPDLPRVRRRLPPHPGWLRRPSRPRWLRAPRRKAIATGIGIVLAAGSLGASGYMVWHHRTTVHKQQLAAEFSAAARQGVTLLMTMDASHAREDLQRIIDDTTGDLKSQLSAMSGLMAEQAAESKASSKATIEAVAVESLSEDSAVVLVAARSDITNADTNRPRVVWRISVGITRDGGQLKMSKVDFLQ